MAPVPLGSTAGGLAILRMLKVERQGMMEKYYAGLRSELATWLNYMT